MYLFWRRFPYITLKQLKIKEEKENNEILKEKYYDSLFYKIIETETKSVKQDTIVTFCFKYFDYNRNIRDTQIERAKKNKEDLKNLESELANDVRINNQEAIESALYSFSYFLFIAINFPSLQSLM